MTNPSAAQSWPSSKGTEIERIMAKIEQDNRILAELDHSRSTTLGMCLVPFSPSEFILINFFCWRRRTSDERKQSRVRGEQSTHFAHHDVAHHAVDLPHVHPLWAHQQLSSSRSFLARVLTVEHQLQPSNIAAVQQLRQPLHEQAESNERVSAHRPPSALGRLGPDEFGADGVGAVGARTNRTFKFRAYQCIRVESSADIRRSQYGNFYVRKSDDRVFDATLFDVHDKYNV